MCGRAGTLRLRSLVYVLTHQNVLIRKHELIYKEILASACRRGALASSPARQIGKPQDDHRSLRCAFCDVRSTPMVLHELPDQRKPEANADGVQTEERLKDLLSRLCGNPTAGVGDVKPDYRRLAYSPSTRLAVDRRYPGAWPRLRCRVDFRWPARDVDNPS